MRQATTADSKQRTIWLLVVFAGFVFGASGLLSKGLIDRGVDSFTVTSVPFLIGGVVAWVAAWRGDNISAGALLAGAILGVINSALPALFFNIGFETLPAGLVTLILSLGPVVTAAAAHLVFADERFNPLKGLGLLLAFTGVAALIAAPGVIEGASYRGAAWSTAGAVLAGLSVILARRFAVRHGALALVAPQLSIAGLTPIAIGLLVGRSLVPVDGFAGGDIPILAVIGIGASYGGVRALLQANEIGTTGQVSMISYLIPLVGVVGGIVFFSEQLTPWIAFGGGLILAGVTVGGRASTPTLLPAVDQPLS